MQRAASATLLIAAVPVLLAACLAAGVRAQSVSGRLVDRTDGRPVESAFVQLLDAGGVPRAGTLTDSSGRFTLQAQSTGDYRLLAERLGYEAVTSPPFFVGPTGIRYAFEIDPRALVLPSVIARSDDSRGCRRRPDGEAVAALWEAVRSALSVTAWTARTGSIRFSMMNHARELDRSQRTINREVRSAEYATAARPYGAVDPEQLARDGYAVTEDGDTWLLGPDADVLLSESFLDSHCFAIAGSEHRSRIGLAFTPLRKDGRTDVSGVLWVDRATAALQSLEFEYEGLPVHMSPFGASGQVHFRRLNTGAWIVSKWWIRSPLVRRYGMSDYRLLGYREDGGAVTRTEAIDLALRSRRGSGVIEGWVHDGMTDRPFANALVILSGTPFSSVTDSTGWYRLERIPSGEYTIGATHPTLDDIGMAQVLDTVSVPGRGTIRRDFSTASMPEVLSTVCPGEPEDIATGLLYGYVRNEDTGEPLAGIEVRATWRGPPPDARESDRNVDRSRAVMTDQHGRYSLCWMPVDRVVRIRVNSRDAGQRDRRVEMSAGPVLRQDF